MRSYGCAAVHAACRYIRAVGAMPLLSRVSAEFVCACCDLCGVGVRSASAQRKWYGKNRTVVIENWSPARTCPVRSGPALDVKAGAQTHGRHCDNSWGAQVERSR